MVARVLLQCSVWFLGCWWFARVLLWFWVDVRLGCLVWFLGCLWRLGWLLGYYYGFGWLLWCFVWFLGCCWWFGRLLGYCQCDIMVARVLLWCFVWLLGCSVRFLGCYQGGCSGVVEGLRNLGNLILFFCCFFF